MEASDTTIGSYAWSSILKGRDVLMKGATWRVGCGESIGVWNDAWLPSLEYPRMLSNMVTSFEDMKVNDLVDPVSNQWDAGLLQGLFSSQEVELIMSIPLCRTYIEDKLIWLYTSSGNYTVKSGIIFLLLQKWTRPPQPIWDMMEGFGSLFRASRFQIRWRISYGEPAKKHYLWRKTWDGDKSLRMTLVITVNQM